MSSSITNSFETRDGQLRIAADAQLSTWLAELGECADPNCGCYRPKHPSVRQRFKQMLLASVRAPTTQHPRLRYVSVGSGGLLYDLELILALREKHGPACVELVVAIDRKYCFDGRAVVVCRAGSPAPTALLYSIND